MNKLYTETQINKALKLIREKGKTRREAALKTGINQNSLNYYLKAKTKHNDLEAFKLKITEAIKTLQNLL